MAKQFSKTHILRHVLTHKIHHIGQLSVWARELGIPPVAANFFKRML
ncbi:DinB family protein [Bacillus atrophaeus]